MIRKYKLIKKYPGSPKLGTILQYESGYYLQKNIGNTAIIREEIENYPEFWKEVVEKDYEILSFSQNISNEIVKVSRTDLALSVEEFLKNKCWSIRSVKRLSDGEIFTIGSNTNEGIIKEFQLCENNRIIISFVDGLPRFLDAKGSTHILKVKQPLFTTEDGVDIFEGDIYHSILCNSFEYKGIYIAEVPNGGKFTNPDTCKTFSTKEAAEEYILMNKPCLSINDVINNSNVLTNGVYFETMINDLKELVKNKI